MRRLLPALMLLILQLPARGQGYDPAKVGKKAAAAYRKALEIASDGQFREAIRWVDQAIAADARFVDAYLSKAGLHGELKESEPGIHALLRDIWGPFAWERPSGR